VFALQRNQGGGVDDGVAPAHGSRDGRFVGHVPGDQLEVARPLRAENAGNLVRVANQESGLVPVVEQRAGQV
jgi:hypothetical protein